MLEPSVATAGPLVPVVSQESDGYVIAGFTPVDAPDIPLAFRAVYGEDYLSKLVYDPEAFTEQVTSGAQISFVARDAAGEIAGHIALAFSAPNRAVVELCQGIVTPAHRKSGIFVRMIDRAIEFAQATLGAQAILGISLTNHIISQKIVAKIGFKDVGMELDYVPQRMLVQERAEGPAATLLQYFDLGRTEHALCHLPPSYALWFARLLSDGNIAGPRQITMATGLDERVSLCEAKDMPRFDMARLLVRRAGADFWPLVGEAEAAAEAAGRRNFQVLINLASAEGAAAVELLRGWGYACSGLLPGYLEGGKHVAIMYRSFERPNFEGIRLHDGGAERLLAAVVTDWERADRLGAELRQVIENDLAEILAPAAAPLQKHQIPLAATRQLLGLEGHISLESGGMAPVDLGEGSDHADTPLPQVPAARDKLRRERGKAAG